MNITLFTLGTRGDVQPYLALALGLQRLGHQPTLVAPRGFCEWITSYGVQAVPVRFDLQEFMQQPETQSALKSGSLLRQYRMMRSVMETGVLDALDDFWQAALDTDFVLQAGTASGGLELAEQRGFPLAYAALVPSAPTRHFPPFFLPFRFSLGGAYNRLLHTLLERLLWRGIGGPTINRWRTTRRGLPPWRYYSEMLTATRRLEPLWLYAFSPSLLPKPPDWGPERHVTGYWFLDPPPGWQPPEDLLHFLENGPPPVYIGFGSLRVPDPQALTRLALEALELTGQRGVLLEGWGALERLPAPESALFIRDVPHAWLFPRTAAVVHHGGAGTTAAVLRAGVPGIITPFAGDQYAWAEQVRKLGVGPSPVGIKKLTAPKLAGAIRQAVGDPGLRARVAALGEQIRAEDGVASAAALIERHAMTASLRNEK